MTEERRRGEQLDFNAECRRIAEWFIRSGGTMAQMADELRNFKQFIERGSVKDWSPKSRKRDKAT